ncbi:helix-hairpin-helix domain-containing protein [Pseudomonas sp. MF6772]|jgi:competence protein ComEA|uniref:ComEA family DNA-binding protein n=1 Tax=Pseudomonas TaxID=286 RepID=UPI000DFE2BDD|nr:MULTISPECIES: helix-hairpin-helix domain-containing protein [Pseudomonas]MBJ2267529.1 helix-hairpin-helix domain-containing protein [Pseudomonas sp. MF6772]MCU0214182.1 helix-hairpin-helix domain-containing protein [Pseudomonas shahriarae]MDD0981285.1 helix-hairpin-helix domain-containing protein [Pseudomonas shahriarae]SUD43902.1 competence protein ComEA [Pseudomonas fluorescens]
MRRSVFSSLLFALLTSLSAASIAAPSAKPEAPQPLAAQLSASEQPTPKVNLNAADAETLRRDLFGIGAAKAKAIIAYRESNGSFTVVDELLEVKGIGKSLLEKNRDRLEVK